MKPKCLIACLEITLLSALIFACSCDDKLNNIPAIDKNPSDTAIAVNWVGTDIVYDSTLEKKDYSCIYFHASWCGYCKKLESETFRDPTVSKIFSESFNMAKIDIDSDTLVRYYDSAVTCNDLARIYQISGIPDLCFFGKKGNYIGRATGYRNAAGLAPILEDIRDGKYGQKLSNNMHP
ncbi:exported hypothetical protein [Candidatus Zixiibacteriota bacterium]|nr:exported hypothetical protein [candidate division Zixibacteria bacterium]